MKSSSVQFLTIFFVTINLSVAAYFFFRDEGKTVTADLATPTAAIDLLESKPLFFNEAALPFLRERKPALLGEEGSDAQRIRAYTAALNDPKLWRQLDRRYRFSAVLLVGDPAMYRPLLAHLLASADWPLTYLDHMGYVFQRAPAKAWAIGNLDALKAGFEKIPAQERAAFLSQLAGKLAGVNQFTAAKSCLDQALKIDPKSPPAWTQLGNYHAHFSQWAEASAKFDQALATDPKFLPAIAAKAQVLVAMHKTNEAFALAEKIYEAAPDDPAMLFLVAKVAHSAHAYWREIEALQRLIALAERNAQPVAGYCIYLAQAYASQGEAKPALEQFDKALADPDLSAEQRSFVEETVATIKSKVSL